MKKTKWLKYILPFSSLALLSPVLLTSCSSTKQKETKTNNEMILSDYNLLCDSLNYLERSYIDSGLTSQYVIVPIKIEHLTSTNFVYHSYTFNQNLAGSKGFAKKNIILASNSRKWVDQTWFLNAFSKYSEVGANIITFSLFYEEQGTYDAYVKEWNEGKTRVSYKYELK